jgi:hypothetical protein
MVCQIAPYALDHSRAPLAQLGTLPGEVAPPLLLNYSAKRDGFEPVGLVILAMKFDLHICR